MKKWTREDYRYPITDEFIEYYNLCEEYREKFHRGYGVTIGDCRPITEHNEILKEALRTGKPVEKPEIPANIVL